MSSFEEHINKKVKNHPTEVDTDALWNSIKEDIPKEKDKRRGIFFLFLILGLSIIGGITMISKDSISEDSLANRIAILGDGNESISDNSESIINDIIEELPILSKSNTNPNNSDSNLSNKSNQVTSYQTALNNLDINYPSDLLNITSKSTDKNVIISSSSPIIVKEEVNEEEIQELSNKLGLESIPYMLAILNMDMEEQLLAVNLENEEESFEDFEEEEEESTSKKKKFTIQGGFHTAFGSTKSLINAKSIDSEVYANRRLKSETPEGFFEIGFDAVIKLDNGLKLRTGLSYTRIREDFALRVSNLNQIPNSQDNNNVPGLQQDGLLADISTSVSSPSSLNPIQNDRVTFRNDNLYTMLDLPIVLGYDLSLGRKFSLGFEGGTYINLFSNADGFIAHPSGRLFKLDSGIIKSHKNNILLSTYTGLSINYEIAPKLDIQLGGQYRYTPFSITDKSYSLDQKYSAFGVSIGMLFDIN